MTSLARVSRSERLQAAIPSLCLVLALLAIGGRSQAEDLTDSQDITGSQDITSSQELTAHLASLREAALVHTLNAELLGNPSATLTLDRWCADHRLAPEGSKIVAERIRGMDKPADGSVRALLRIGTNEPVAYRRVRLKCGERVLSEADNWYVPALLTPEMNRTLETTDTSFGRVVAPLRFQRETLSAKLLLSPYGAKEMPALPPFVLQHRAVLLLSDGRPFSALVESYTRDVLAAP
ncbi:MAG: hypothetical protein K0R27_2856 [Xanthobacteraceae bacterium]|jgi:hypothetical protein|nr:hypothetical protein [Xanthobacteraceae bacterium]